MITLAGLPFRVESQQALLPQEVEWLSRVSAANDIASNTEPFVLERRTISAPAAAAMRSYPADTSPRVGWERERVVITHHGFLAEIDPFANRGWCCQTMDSRAPLEITLKVAMCSMLPLAGGVPLHAAGIVLNGAAGVFFGPSGAGKSTLASLAPDQVLSDELVAIQEGNGFEVRATGFWGTLDADGAPSTAFPLCGLFELHKEGAFRLTPLDPPSLVRRLLGVVLVPTAPPLWSRVLSVLARIGHSVPGYELGWAIEQPPWVALQTTTSPSMT